MPEQLQKLRSAFEKHDAKELRACAHRIKGSALALAAQRMSESAEALQHLAEAEKLEEAGPILQQIETQYETVARLLELELASAKPSQHGAS
jgi:HPt (histidine-containing phosphotransfer) domain-containing protein